MDRGIERITVSPKILKRGSYIRSTETYLHSTDDRKVEAIESLQFGV
jgi:hypothetical protein